MKEETGLCLAEHSVECLKFFDKLDYDLACNSGSATRKEEKLEVLGRKPISPSL